MQRVLSIPVAVYIVFIYVKDILHKPNDSREYLALYTVHEQYIIK